MSDKCDNIAPKGFLSVEAEAITKQLRASMGKGEDDLRAETDTLVGEEEQQLERRRRASKSTIEAAAEVARSALDIHDSYKGRNPMQGMYARIQGVESGGPGTLASDDLALETARQTAMVDLRSALGKDENGKDVLDGLQWDSNMRPSAEDINAVDRVRLRKKDVRDRKSVV